MKRKLSLTDDSSGGAIIDKTPLLYKNSTITLIIIIKFVLSQSFINLEQLL